MIRQKKHIHTYSNIISHDIVYHYNKATCEHSDKVINKSRHTFVKNTDNDYLTCSVCGIEVEEYTCLEFVKAINEKVGTDRGSTYIKPIPEGYTSYGVPVTHGLFQYKKYNYDTNVYDKYIYVGGIKLTGGFENTDSYSFAGVTSYDFSDVNTTDVTQLMHFFGKNSETNLNKIDTHNMKSFYMFFENEYETLDLSTFDTTNATDMSSMFSGKSKLKSLDVSGFNTSNVNNMSYMFSSCSNLKTLDLSNFNTSNVTDMSNMFSGCSNLEKLDLSNFDTSNTTNMNGMFTNCKNLKELDLSSFDTSKFTNYSYNYGFDKFPMFLSYSRSASTKIGTKENPLIVYIGPKWTLYKEDIDYYFDYYGHTAGTENDYSGTVITEVHIKFIEKK